MRKHASFTVAALTLALAVILLAVSHLDETVAGGLQPKAGTPYAAPVSSFLPVKGLEPLW